jgi:hypothetical protein
VIQEGLVKEAVFATRVPSNKEIAMDKCKVIAVVLFSLIFVSSVAVAEKVVDNVVKNPPTGDPFAPTGIISLYKECFATCSSPWGFSVINSGDNLVGNSWDNPFDCGIGFFADCPPDTAGTCAVCVSGPPSEQQVEWFISPPIDASVVNMSMTLSFYQSFNWWGYCTEPNQVLVSTTGTDPVDFQPVWTMECTDAWSPDTPVIIDLSTYAGSSTFYFAFKYSGTWAEDWFIDEILLIGEYMTPAEDINWGEMKTLFR